MIAFLVAQRNVRRVRWNFPCGCNFFRWLSTRDFANEFGRALRCAKYHSRIDTALKTVTRVARQVQIARRSSNTRRREVSSFEQNISCRFGNAGFLAAHHTANSDRALVIGDHEVLGRKGISFPVEREKLLAFAGQAHIDRAFEFVGIERVCGLTHLKHHKVGDVDDIVDRTNSDALNFCA